jgi:urease accessory protein
MVPAAITIITGMAMITTDAALYRLMTWLSPSYPVGAFSYSHGLEYAIEDGSVRNAADLTGWISTVVERGAGSIDGALFAAAWRAAKVDDRDALRNIAELAVAWRGTSEMALESTAQGDAFVTITKTVWPVAILKDETSLPIAVAVGATAAAHGIPLHQALSAYLTAFVANLVSAGVRLVPLGQTDGQRTIAALEPVVLRTVEAALEAPLDDLGTATPLVDWCSMKHETQYTRLFRS